MSSDTPPRLILVGGFLGAGKTTLLLAAARRLAAQGQRVGLVMNDQGEGLVDTALATGNGWQVEEVAGGCFCCRFPDLIEALRRLQTTVAPDVILAEPVGSCTDLLATVVRPLQALHPGRFTIAPLTIVLDGSRQVETFSGTVDYLYQQQLQEAEILLLNKVDLLTPTQHADELRRLTNRYGPTPVIATSAKEGGQLDAWLAQVMTGESGAVKALAIDYQRYGEAEAELAWLNLGAEIEADVQFSARNWLRHLLQLLNQGLAQQRAAIAHIKAQVMAAAGVYKASITATGAPVSWDEVAAQPGASAVGNKLTFVLNARVQTTPEILERSVRHVLAEIAPEPEFCCVVKHFECFRPKAPEPTYRFESSRD